MPWFRAAVLAITCASLAGVLATAALHKLISPASATSEVMSFLGATPAMSAAVVGSLAATELGLVLIALFGAHPSKFLGASGCYLLSVSVVASLLGDHGTVCPCGLGSQTTVTGMWVRNLLLVAIASMGVVAGGGVTAVFSARASRQFGRLFAVAAIGGAACGLLYASLVPCVTLDLMVSATSADPGTRFVLVMLRNESQGPVRIRSGSTLCGCADILVLQEGPIPGGSSATIAIYEREPWYLRDEARGTLGAEIDVESAGGVVAKYRIQVQD